MRSAVRRSAVIVAIIMTTLIIAAIFSATRLITIATSSITAEILAGRRSAWTVALGLCGRRERKGRTRSGVVSY